MCDKACLDLSRRFTTCICVVCLHTLLLRLGAQALHMTDVYDVMLVRYVSGMLEGSFGSVYAIACLDLVVRTLFSQDDSKVDKQTSEC